MGLPELLALKDGFTSIFLSEAVSPLLKGLFAYSYSVCDLL